MTATRCVAALLTRLLLASAALSAGTAYADDTPPATPDTAGAQDSAGTAGTPAITPGTTPATPPGTAPGTPATPGKWKIAFGPGIVVTSKYPGSRRLSVFPFPSLDISYDERFFSQGPDVLGVNVLTNPDYHVGAALTLDFQERKERDDPRLHGLGNVDSGPKLKLFADYTVWAFTGSVALYQDIAGNHQGTTVSTDLYASAPVGGWLFSVGPGFTWANGTYTRTFFSVSNQQSAASGLPTYGTSAGIRDVHLNTYVSYDFSKHWAGSVATTFGRLQHDAAHSPISERTFELNMLASLNYRY